jgi:hypothetical protein
VQWRSFNSARFMYVTCYRPTQFTHYHHSMKLMLWFVWCHRKSMNIRSEGVAHRQCRIWEPWWSSADVYDRYLAKILFPLSVILSYILFTLSISLMHRFMLILACLICSYFLVFHFKFLLTKAPSTPSMNNLACFLSLYLFLCFINVLQPVIISFFFLLGILYICLVLKLLHRFFFKFLLLFQLLSLLFFKKPLFYMLRIEVHSKGCTYVLYLRRKHLTFYRACNCSVRWYT